MVKYQTVDEYIASFPDWQEELNILRSLLQSTGLEEGIKWGMPVYMHSGKNVAGIGAFKSYVGIWFFQGALLKDRKQVLQSAQGSQTRAMRQWRFQSVDELDTEGILEYVREAVSNQKAGKVIKPERKKKFPVPEELKGAFAENIRLKSAFYQLSSARQNEYCEYIGEAKREVTRRERMIRVIPWILEGKGLNDRYR